MVQDRWRDTDANAALASAGPDPADQALALRVYTSRLIGADPDLVMHGGGNTSVKVRRRDLFGREIEVLHVKGSGWDLETIEARGLPGVRMAELKELRALATLSDEDMVNVQRCNLLDCTAPTPSVETLLHAYLPHAVVDHTHATAMLALANLPDVAAACREIFGDRVALVPYIMPGLALAKAAAAVFEENPDVEGLLLVNHGHFTFGDDSRQSYRRVVDHVNEVEAWFAGRAAPHLTVPRSNHAAIDILPVLRGAIAEVASDDRDAAMPVFDLRAGPEVITFLERPDLASLARSGPATPDHVIRTKGFPLLLPPAVVADGRTAIEAATRKFAAEYRAYFARQAPRAAQPKTMLAPTPGLAWIPGLGIVGIGADAQAARIAADLGEQTVRVMNDAVAAGGFRSIGEDDIFDMEYWSLEQAKLGKGASPPFRGRIVLVTGAAGAIGRAIVQAFRASGASVFLVDRDAEALERTMKTLGCDAGGVVLDLADEAAGHAAVEACVERFGGLDIVVSNAGAAWTGEMANLPEATLRKSFELNFFAHHHLAQAAVAVLRAQGRGGQLLFNVSKQAVNPGKGFGAYGLPKAATFFLVRQLALELGGDGIRVNGVNADRIRSGLLTDAFIAERAQARGIDAAAYMAGNLLKREVEARHVADAFAALARAERTTGHVMTVDGGNIEASLR
jgi:rhamnose utilization protein RhaD (predicted bifunctional aldolase and dehydrogenase)/NAD(P)-dependent dehydrogenase (short-subunit alcohol dehydrogenase family)